MRRFSRHRSTSWAALRPCRCRPFVIAPMGRPALQADLELEERQLQRYRDRVAEAGTLGLPDVAEALRPLLEQTQDHVDRTAGRSR